MRGYETPKITVAVRKRPLNRKELQRSETDIIRVNGGGHVVISEHKQKVDLTKYLEETTFHFDYSYDENSRNEEIYDQAVRPLIENAFRGAKISCFAYGQTGSGKTYTMKGDLAKGMPGIYYLGAKEIFRYLQLPQHRSKQIIVTFYDIYCGKLHDLLNNRNQLQIREDGKGNINVIGLNEKLICSAQEFMDIIEEGSVHRITSQNNTNDESSRSHAILQITVRQKKKTFTKISFIDLAGNERGADHMDMNKQTKVDGAEINKSLLALKECIRALDQGKSHAPFRDSKLTMVLKDSLIGNCKTIMICNISPNSSSSENTMNTLRYADRVKELKSRDEGQKLTKEQMLSRELMLPRGHNKNSVKVNIERGDDQQQIKLKMDLARAQQLNQNFIVPCDEKMEIEDHFNNNNNNIFSQPYQRKTEQTFDLKVAADKRMTGREQNRTKPINNGFAGRDLQTEQFKQPLKNVTKKISQNNINVANGFGPDFLKPNKLFNSNSNPPANLNRSHYEAINNLRSDFSTFLEEHDQLIRQQMQILREECQMREDFNHLAATHYEQEIQNANNYANGIEKILQRREEIHNKIKNSWEKLRIEIRNAETVNAQFRYEQQKQQKVTNYMGPNIANNGSKSQTRIHLHSNTGGLNFGGFNNNHYSHHDEQLLEGLGQEGRLF